MEENLFIEWREDEICELYKIIGANVARIRKEKGLTQLDLAYAMGLKAVGLVSVAEIGHNKRHFNIEHLYKIASILNVPLCVFFEGIKTENFSHNTFT